MSTTRFGQWLVDARKAAGMSQAELARRIGVSDTYISAIETGRKTAPPHAHVQAIAACLGADEGQLWGLALADREQRLRERLAGVPTALKSDARPSSNGQAADPSPNTGATSDASSIVNCIDELLPSIEEREQFVRSLEVLIEILKAKP